MVWPNVMVLESRFRGSSFLQPWLAQADRSYRVGPSYMQKMGMTSGLAIRKLRLPSGRILDVCKILAPAHIAVDASMRKKGGRDPVIVVERPESQQAPPVQMGAKRVV